MVSICMAAYNGERHIYEQIQSILPQLTTDDELIISDDGSTDKTISIIESFHDPRIKIYENTQHGVVANFENALSKAKGEYLFLCDQDDVWLPAKIASCLEKLQKYTLVVTDCFIVSENLEMVSESYFATLNAGPGVFRNLRKNTYQGCCMCFKKEVMPLIMPFPKNIPMHDAWIGFVANLFFKVLFDPVKLSLYRRHNSTATHHIVGKSTASVLKKISYRLVLIAQLPRLFKRRFFN